MHRPLWIGLLLGVVAYVTCGASAQSQALPGNTQKTARIALAQEFVRELEVLYRLQETAGVCRGQLGVWKNNDQHKGWYSHALAIRRLALQRPQF